jgi:hypothetical protein
LPSGGNAKIRAPVTSSDIGSVTRSDGLKSRFSYGERAMVVFGDEMKRILDMPEMNMMFRLHEVTFDDPSMADQNGWYWEKINSVNEEVRVDKLIGPFKTEDDAAEAARTTLCEGHSPVDGRCPTSGRKTRH